MNAIITADIVNSQSILPEQWLEPLTKILNTIGEEYTTWEVFRGDSFQLKTSPEKVLEIAILLKATVKKINDIDIRIAIGIGDITFTAEKLTASNGSAFVHSGTCFDTLKKSTLAIKSPWLAFDQKMNIMFDLASLTMNQWKPTTAEIVAIQLLHKKLKQKDLAIILGKNQSNVSAGLKRAGYDEIMACIKYYQSEIQLLCS